MQIVEAKQERPLDEQKDSFQVFSLDLLQSSTKSRWECVNITFQAVHWSSSFTHKSHPRTGRVLEPDHAMMSLSLR